jgi:hypothetical protein
VLADLGMRVQGELRRARGMARVARSGVQA